MREPRNLLLGQNVTPRRPRRRLLQSVLRFFLIPALCCSICLAVGLFLGYNAPHAAPWLPAHLRLVPPISRSQATVTAYVPTDQTWLILVQWGPARAGERFLGNGGGVCSIGVAASASGPAQLEAIQAGIAKCFKRAFGAKAFPPGGSNG